METNLRPKNPLSGLLANYVEKMGGNMLVASLGNEFLIASMVPSLTFVAASMVVFEQPNMFPTSFQTENGLNELIGFSFILIILTIIIGFILTALNTYILKFFEGHVFFQHFSFLAKNQQKKAIKMLARRERLARRIRRLETKDKKRKRDKWLISSLKNEYYSIAVEYDNNFPRYLGDVLPTSLGNSLRAAESYPATRYGIDTTFFWPRLIHVIPKDYQQTIDQSWNELSFLVNYTFLSFLFAFLCFVKIMIILLSSIVVNSSNVEPVSIYKFIFAGIGSLTLGCIFHRAALISVGSFAQVIRSAYDLFRHRLLENLKIKLPDDFREEFYTWKNLGEFIVLGHASLDLENLEYEIKADTGEQFSISVRSLRQSE